MLSKHQFRRYSHFHIAVGYIAGRDRLSREGADSTATLLPVALGITRVPQHWRALMASEILF